MADNEVDGFVLKIGAEVDKADLKKIQEQLKELQKKTLENALKLGINMGGGGAGGATRVGPTTTSEERIAEINAKSKASQDLVLFKEQRKAIADKLKQEKKNSDEIRKVNERSDKIYYQQILEDKKKSNAKIEAEEEEALNKDNDKKPKPDKPGGWALAPIVKDVSNMGSGEVIGKLMGGLIGSAFGKSEAGAKAGRIVGMLGDTGVGVAKYAKEGVLKRVQEDMRFAQLSYQTGQVVKSLHVFDEKLQLTGSNLQTLVDTSSNLSTELFTGLSPLKAQMLMALHKNPMDYVQGMMRDPMGETLNTARLIDAAMGNKMPGARQGAYGLMGIPQNLGFAAKNMNTPEVNDSVKKIMNEMEANGEVLLKTSSEIVAQFRDFMTNERVAVAQDRALFTSTIMTDIAKAYQEAVITVQSARNVFIYGVGNLVQEVKDKGVGGAITDTLKYDRDYGKQSFRNTLNTLEGWGKSAEDSINYLPNRPGAPRASAPDGGM